MAVRAGASSTNNTTGIGGSSIFGGQAAQNIGTNVAGTAAVTYGGGGGGGVSGNSNVAGGAGYSGVVIIEY
jgi:hypothetical protein